MGHISQTSMRICESPMDLIRMQTWMGLEIFVVLETSMSGSCCWSPEHTLSSKT